MNNTRYETITFSKGGNKMTKMLMLASVASMIDQFNRHNMKILESLNVEVQVAANFAAGNSTSPEKVSSFAADMDTKKINHFQIDFSRSIVNIFNHIKAYKQLVTLFKENQYDFVHCHSPIGGVIGRLVAKKFGVPVIYTAHGFHFHNKSSWMSWKLFYPIEKWLSSYTDTLITINKEDYQTAQDFLPKYLEYIPGVGLEVDKFRQNLNSESTLKEELGLSKDDFVILSVGELNKNKNHRAIIKALGLIQNPHIHYLVCGQGELKEELNQLAKEQQISGQVKFLGFRDDIQNVFKGADLFVFPSFREGLSVALMEAMASGLPVVCSDIRGNNDLIDQSRGGFLFDPRNEKELKDSIVKAYEQPELLKAQTEYNFEKINEFSLKVVSKEMKRIYSRYL
ncbi:glycosyltransferase [Aerococcaceae bacterium DSM 109653]|uniref:Glycosyltransferase n=2 Tax=Fundicoccus ignavus TaxID=2664442 RepID=A0A844BIJ0_9LACT|nr:glycosyltransferase [Fundicoccus ignavus]